MKIVKQIILLVLIGTVLACEKDNELIINTPDALMGSWINPEISDTVWKYDRANALKDNEYGFSFQPEKLFIERKNAGWCGTPPISYADFDGSWSMKDSIISISVGFWGGMADYQWKIVSIDENHLTIYRMKENYPLIK